MDFITALKQNNITECMVKFKSDLHNHIDLGGDFTYVSQKFRHGKLLIQPKEHYDGVTGMDNKFLKDFLTHFPESEDLVFLWAAALTESHDNGIYRLSPDIGKCAKHKFNGSLKLG